LAVAVTFGATRPGCTPCRFSSPAHEPAEQGRGDIVTDTAMRAAIAAERHDLAAVLRHRVRLCAHRRLIRSSDGWERAVALEPKSVAQFYAEVMAALRELTLEVSIRTTGTEVERAIPFQDDHEHAGCQALRSPTPHRVSRGWRSG